MSVSALIDKLYAFGLNGSLEKDESVLERQRRIGTHATDEISQRHQKPEALNPHGRANLIFVKGQLLFRVTKEELNLLSESVTVQNIRDGKRKVCAKKSA